MANEKMYKKSKHHLLQRDKLKVVDPKRLIHVVYINNRLDYVNYKTGIVCYL